MDELATRECERQSITRAEYRFTRRAVREATQWSETQLRVHLARLVELEYLLIHRGGRGQSFVYELLFESNGEASKPRLTGLTDVDTIRTSRGEQPTSRGVRGPFAEPENLDQPTDAEEDRDNFAAAAVAHIAGAKNTRSYVLTRSAIGSK